jgi:hypothetical protein
MAKGPEKVLKTKYFIQLLNRKNANLQQEKKEKALYKLVAKMNQKKITTWEFE